MVDWPSIEERFIVFILESDLRAIAYLIIYLGAINNWRLPLRGEGGITKRWCYSISQFSKMSDKGEGGVKNLKKWVTSFMDGP